MCHEERALILELVEGPTLAERTALGPMFSPAVQLDHTLAESFVGFDGALRNRRSYGRFRGFFLPDSARSRLRR